MPDPESLLGFDANALSSQCGALSLALERGLAGMTTIEVDDWGGKPVSVRGFPAPLRGSPGALLVCLDAAPIAAWMRLYEAQLRQFMMRTRACTWITDSELRITHATGAVLSPGTRDPEMVVGQSLQEILDTDDPTHPVIAYHRAALDGGSTQFRYQVGGRSFDVYLEPWRGIGDRVRGCVGLSLDITDALARQERLEASERWLAESQRVAHLGSWQWHVGKDLVEWSEEMHRIYGLEPGTFEGTYRGFFNRLHPDDRALTENMVLTALRTCQPFQFDHRIIRADGGVRTLCTVGEVRCDAAGQPWALFGSCLDVTERRRVSEEKNRALSLLRATLESTQDGILVITRDGRVATYNQRFLDLWGFARETIATGSDEQLLMSALPMLEDPDAFMARVRDLYDQPEAESFDTIAFKDGRLFERYSQPQRIDGEVVGRVMSFRDVTEKARLLSRAVFLADGSRLLGSLDIEAALKAVVNLIVPFWAEACAIDLFVEDAGPRRLVAGDAARAGALLEELPRAALAGQSLIYEVARRSCLAVPLGGRETILGVVTMAAAAGRKYDQRDLELAEELGHRMALAIENARLCRRTEQMVKMRDEFLSIAAHELRGPATSLNLAVQSLRMGGLSPETAGRTLDLLERQVRQIARFIDELLDVGRIRAGRLHVELAEVDLTVIARDVAARLTPDVTRSGSRLTISSAGRVVGLWDPLRLDQLVTNLLTNAIKFGQGKPIEIEVETHDDKARLRVRDHGIGVPKDRQTGIFHPFERAVSPRRYGGLGLGLYICRTIVESFGGSIGVESEPGHGASFTVELPLRQGRS